MKNKAFTLIELLAVIIILAIIALIATPIILNVIEDSRKSANRSQIEILLNGAETYYANGLLNDITFDETKELYSEIKTTNEKPSNGSIKINSEGKIYLAIYLDGICYTKDFNENDIKENENITNPEECAPTNDIIEVVKNYAYSGDYQTFVAPMTGEYKLEAWGASSHFEKNKGSYTSGYIYLNEGDVIYIYIGQYGKDLPIINRMFFNNGTSDDNGINGGGATDFRLISGNWDDSMGLKSRIMVAAGAGTSNINGGGGAGGGLKGYDGDGTPGGTQITFGTEQYSYFNDSQFGIANGGCTGGGGYYPGGGAACASGSGGGSSFISGHTGAVAIASEDDVTPKAGCTTGTTDNDCSIHYSNIKFTNTIMIDGMGYNWTNEKQQQTEMPSPYGGNYELGKGHEGNGRARITYNINSNEIKDYHYDFTGTEQIFTAPTTGKYKLEAWGASSYYDQNKGGYTSGTITLNEGESIYVYVGQYGQSDTVINHKGFNNGTSDYEGFNGGGSSDFRLINGNWDDDSSLNSRIMVASGAGSSDFIGVGGAAGGLTGYTGLGTTGGNQTTTGSEQYGPFNDSSFGIANGGCTGGGGYYPGGGASCASGSGGGSSFISGHTGAVAITSQTDRTPKAGCTTGTTDNNCSIHYSNLKFENTIMIDGAGYSWTNEKQNQTNMPTPYNGTYELGIGHQGNGHAKITLIN